MTRDYSLVVFGATGFTVQYVAEEVARIADKENITWTIAGRNSEKLNAILENVGKVTGKSIKNVGIIKADVGDPNSLGEMAKKGKIVLNCVGPYQSHELTGQILWRSCSESLCGKCDKPH